MKRLLFILLFVCLAGCQTITIRGKLESYKERGDDWVELHFDDGTEVIVKNNRGFPMYVGHEIELKYSINVNRGSEILSIKSFATTEDREPIRVTREPCKKAEEPKREK